MNLLFQSRPLSVLATVSPDWSRELVGFNPSARPSEATEANSRNFRFKPDVCTWTPPDVYALATYQRRWLFAIDRPIPSKIS